MNKDEDGIKAKVMLNMLIHEYLSKNNYPGTAKIFRVEAEIPDYRDSNSSSILLQWFRIFNDICLLRSGNRRCEDHLAQIEAIMMRLENQKRNVGRIGEYSRVFGRTPYSGPNTPQMGPSTSRQYMPDSNGTPGSFEGYSEYNRVQNPPIDTESYANYNANPMNDPRRNFRRSQVTSNYYGGPTPPNGYQESILQRMQPKYPDNSQAHIKPMKAPVQMYPTRFEDDSIKNPDHYRGQENPKLYEKKFPNFERKEYSLILKHQINFGTEKINIIVPCPSLQIFIIASVNMKMAIVDMINYQILSQNESFGCIINSIAINHTSFENLNRDVLVAACSVSKKLVIYNLKRQPPFLEEIKNIPVSCGVTSCTFGRDCIYTLNIEEEVSKYTLDGKLVGSYRYAEDIRNIIWIRDDLLILNDPTRIIKIDFGVDISPILIYESVNILQRTGDFIVWSNNEEIKVLDLDLQCLAKYPITDKTDSLDLIDEDNLFTASNKMLYWHTPHGFLPYDNSQNTIVCVKVLEASENGIVATSSDSGDVKIWCLKKKLS